MPHSVVFSPEAQDDLRSIYVWIAERSGPDRGRGFIQRIETYCRSFADFPKRGTKRDDLLPGLRIIGFERRVTIAFHVADNAVTFDRILYAGRDMSALSRKSD